MTVFKMGKCTIVCEYYDRRSGFGHKATLDAGGYERETVRCQYGNRTWESFPYQTVALKLIDKTVHLTKCQKTIWRKKLKDL